MGAAMRAFAVPSLAADVSIERVLVLASRRIAKSRVAIRNTIAPNLFAIKPAPSNVIDHTEWHSQEHP
jgi:hypothetical protein